MFLDFSLLKTVPLYISSPNVFLHYPISKHHNPARNILQHESFTLTVSGSWLRISGSHSWLHIIVTLTWGISTQTLLPNQWHRNLWGWDPDISVLFFFFGIIVFKKHFWRLWTSGLFLDTYTAVGLKHEHALAQGSSLEDCHTDHWAPSTEYLILGWSLLF